MREGGRAKNRGKGARYCDGASTHVVHLRSVSCSVTEVSRLSTSFWWYKFGQTLKLNANCIYCYLTHFLFHWEIRPRNTALSCTYYVSLITWSQWMACAEISSEAVAFAFWSPRLGSQGFFIYFSHIWNRTEENIYFQRGAEMRGSHAGFDSWMRLNIIWW